MAQRAAKNLVFRQKSTKPERFGSLPKCILQLPLHCLHIRILNEEGGTKLAELSKLDLSGPVLVDLSQQVLQLLLGRAEAHRSHDLAKVVCGEELLLLGVKEVEANLLKERLRTGRCQNKT